MNNPAPLTPSQQQLAADNLRLVYSAARYFEQKLGAATRLRLDYEDYESLLALALCKTASYFNPSHGCTFSTLFYAVAQNELHKALIANTRDRRKANIDVFYLYADLDGTDLCLDDLLIDKHNVCPEDSAINRVLLETALSKLSNRNRKMLLLRYCGGYTQNEIAKMFHISPQTVSQQIKFTKRKLRKTVEV